MTELTSWRLWIKNGRQVWQYLPTSERVQSVMEKYLLGLDVSEEAPNLPQPSGLKESLFNGVNFYQKLQADDGHWANDYGGPLFLMPGMIIASYICGHDFSKEHKIEMLRYLKGLQHKDGGWGHHIEATSNMFGTSLSYVTIRILGEDKDTEVCKNARKFMKDQGGCTSVPSWAKFWLATLGVYSWEGLNPLTPELWLLPYFFPVHPAKFWCHCRMVYLPMSYVYGVRLTPPINDFIRSLREEIHVLPYDQIDWPAQKWNCSPLDMYTKPTLFLRTMFGALSIYESFASGWLRKRSLDEIIDHIRVEDESTNYVDIGPVNKTINLVSVFHRYGKDSDKLKNHIERLYDYLWLASDGMKMQGYNGSQLWDTAFSIQAILECNMNDQFKESLIKGHHYLDVAQVIEDVPNNDKYYRHISKGAWPFSNRDHGWPISDCTAEGLKASLLLKDINFITPFPEYRYTDAVNVILSLQNTDGGWATYELKRGGNWFEWFNPSEVFHDIMVDYSYVECTSACVQALCKFRQHFPNHRTKEINESIKRGVRFIKSIQRSDGSWIGSWGVCFTYAIWFGIEGLIASGEKTTAPEIKKACQFLISKQRDDGSWGEDFQSCVQRVYVENEKGQVVNTAWSVLALMKGGWDKEPIKKGIQYLIDLQLQNGDWKQESISGVFNANCSISYSGYKNIFPIWAIGRYLNEYVEK